MYVMEEIKCTNTTLPRSLNFDIDNLKVLAQEFPALPSTTMLGKYIGKHFPLSPLALFNTPAAAHNYFTYVDNTACSLDSGGTDVASRGIVPSTCPSSCRAGVPLSGWSQNLCRSRLGHQFNHQRHVNNVEP